MSFQNATPSISGKESKDLMDRITVGPTSVAEIATLLKRTSLNVTQEIVITLSFAL